MKGERRRDGAGVGHVGGDLVYQDDILVEGGRAELVKEVAEHTRFGLVQQRGTSCWHRRRLGCRRRRIWALGDASKCIYTTISPSLFLAINAVVPALIKYLQPKGITSVGDLVEAIMAPACMTTRSAPNVAA